MVGTSESHWGLRFISETGMAVWGHLGCTYVQSSGRGKGSSCIGRRLLRPDGVRPWGLADVERIDARTSSADGQFQFPPCSRSMGSSDDSPCGREMDGADHGEAQRLVRLSGQESKAVGPKTESRRAAKDREQEGQRKRKREKGQGAVGGDDCFVECLNFDIIPHLAEGCQLDGQLFQDGVSGAKVRVPGANAPTSNILVIWNSMVRWMLKSPSATLASFLKSLRSIEPSENEGTANHLWPMPPPFPKWLTGEQLAKSNYKKMCIEKSLNVITICLSWLSLGKPAKAPAAMSLRKSPTRSQWLVVQRLRKLCGEFFDSKDVTPSEMGRSAAKVESLSELLLRHIKPARHRCQSCRYAHSHSDVLRKLLRVFLSTASP